MASATPPRDSTTSNHAGPVGGYTVGNEPSASP